MPYTTGSAADMNAVKTALVNACVNDGWLNQTDAGGNTVLSKNGCYVRAIVGLENKYYSNQDTLELLGRTSLDSGDSPGVVSMGPLAGAVIVFPVNYHIFTFINEVFLVIQYGDKYQFCTFGQCEQPGLPGTGNFIGATLGPRSGIGDSTRAYVSIKSNDGGYPSGWNTSAALSWANRREIGDPADNFWLDSGIDSSYPWTLGNAAYTECPGIKYLTELIETQPNDYNLESVLMPIRVYKQRPSSKVSQVGEIINARHIRIDNYENEQIITMGTDEWMIFPWYRKNVASRAGGDEVDHTGTFGWAIKKEN